MYLPLLMMMYNITFNLVAKFSMPLQKQVNWIVSTISHFDDSTSIEYMSKNETESVKQYLENEVYSGGW